MGEKSLEFFKDIGPQSQTIYVDNNNVKKNKKIKNLSILQDWARWYASGNIEQVIVKILD